MPRAALLFRRVLPLLLLLHLAVPSAALAQGPVDAPPQQGGGPLDAAQKVFAIGQLVGDILQGKQPAGADVLYQQARDSAQQMLGQSRGADLFFLDFGNPDLRLNQFAATLARNLLALTPLYVLAYLVILLLSVWRERPIPNPILYTVLVLAVMIFLAAFGVITQGLGEVGRALATALGGAGDAMYIQGTLLDTIIRVLANLQKEGGLLAILALIIAIVESIIILVQLAYRGLSMALWRLLGVLLIPLSVLIEGVQPKTAGRVIGGFFESWLDMVGKITLLLVVLSIAASETFSGTVWLILPAGLLVVVLSWKFLGVLYVMLRDAVSRAWGDMVPAGVAEQSVPLPAAAEAARARDIDEERRRLLEE